MWLRDPIDIELTRNSQSPIGLQFFDEYTNLPLNVSSYSFKCAVGSSEGSGVIKYFDCKIVDGPNGSVDVNFDGSSLSSQIGSQEIVTFAYQITAFDGQYTVTAMRGSIILTPGVK